MLIFCTTSDKFTSSDAPTSFDVLDGQLGTGSAVDVTALSRFCNMEEKWALGALCMYGSHDLVVGPVFTVGIDLDRLGGPVWRLDGQSAAAVTACLSSKSF